MNPVRYRFLRNGSSVNTLVNKTLIGNGQRLLSHIKNLMGYAKLLQYTKHLTDENGVKYTLKSIFGVDEIWIDEPEEFIEERETIRDPGFIAHCQGLATDADNLWMDSHTFDPNHAQASNPVVIDASKKVGMVVWEAGTDIPVSMAVTPHAGKVSDNDWVYNAEYNFENTDNFWVTESDTASIQNEYGYSLNIATAVTNQDNWYVVNFPDTVVGENEHCGCDIVYTDNGLWMINALYEEHESTYGWPSTGTGYYNYIPQWRSWTTAAVLPGDIPKKCDDDTLANFAKAQQPDTTSATGFSIKDNYEWAIPGTLFNGLYTIKVYIEQQRKDYSGLLGPGGDPNYVPYYISDDTNIELRVKSGRIEKTFNLELTSDDVTNLKLPAWGDEHELWSPNARYNGPFGSNTYESSAYNYQQAVETSYWKGAVLVDGYGGIFYADDLEMIKDPIAIIDSITDFYYPPTGFENTPPSWA